MLANKNVAQDLIDHRYLDITIKGETNTIKEAIFSATRAVPYLKNCNEWELGIVRFSVPSTTIPLFFFNPLWEIVVYYGAGNKKQQVLLYDIGFSPFVNLGPYANKQPIYNVDDFIKMVNDAIKSAVLDLNADTGETYKPPQFVFNSGTGIISLFAPTIPYDDAATGAIGMNGALFEFFKSISATSYKNDPYFFDWFIFRVYNKLNNTETIGGVEYIRMDGDASTIDNWEILTQIVVSCNSVPVCPEMRAVDASAIPVQKSILTDFNFVGLLNNNLNIQFYNQGNIRWYDMVSAHELTRFDLEFNWGDVKGNVYPLYILGNESANIKICFRKKERFTSGDKGMY